MNHSSQMLAQSIDDFLAAKATANLSLKSIEVYEDALRSYSAIVDDILLKDVTPNSINSYLTCVKERGVSASTQEQNLRYGCCL